MKKGDLVVIQTDIDDYVGYVQEYNKEDEILWLSHDKAGIERLYFSTKEIKKYEFLIGNQIFEKEIEYLRESNFRRIQFLEKQNKNLIEQITNLVTTEVKPIHVNLNKEDFLKFRKDLMGDWK